MQLAKQEIQVEQRCRVTGSCAVMEGSLRIPDGLPDAGTILEVAGQAECEEVRMGEGKAEVLGSARFTVLYADGDGQPRSFESQCRLRHEVENEGFTPSMRMLGRIRVGRATARVSGGRNVQLRARLEVDILGAENKTLSLLAGEPREGLQLRCLPAQVPVLQAVKSRRAHVSEQVRIPQSLPAAEAVLLSRGYGVVTAIHGEEDTLAVEGELKLIFVYLSSDKNAPLQHFAETLPFGLVMEGIAGAENDHVDVHAQLERLLVEADPDNADVLRVSAHVAVGAACRTCHEVQLVADAYDCHRESRCTCTDLTVGSQKVGEREKKIIRLGAALPEDAADVARVLYAVAEPQVSEAAVARGRLNIRGTVDVLLCYTAAEVGLTGCRMELPFETDVSAEGLEDGPARCLVFAEYAQAEGSGRELELKICLEICPCQQWETCLQAVSDMTFGEQLPQRERGISVCFAGGRDSLWQMARRLAVPPDAFLEGGDPDRVPQKGERLLLIRR
ncbi:MAG: DUF3794 domain-containing protein [Christensenellaceae bacterium]|nr:DUF3794 domain-containing protein [Christensenellaceae bacterium]